MTVGTVIGDLPLFWPVVGLVTLLAAALAPALRRMLGVPGWVAFGGLASLGLIGAATLTPTSLVAVGPWLASNGCRVGELHIPTLTSLTDINETSLNVALFVPLGLACGLLRNLGQIATAGLVAALVPAGIELVQGSVPALGRVCSTDDVIANLLGLAVGLAGGLVVSTARLAARADVDR